MTHSCMHMHVPHPCTPCAPITQASGRYSLIFVSAWGDEVARAYKFTSPALATLADLYRSINTHMPQGVQSFGLNVLKEPCDGFNLVVNRIEDFFGLEFQYVAAAATSLKR